MSAHGNTENTEEKYSAASSQLSEQVAQLRKKEELTEDERQKQFNKLMKGVTAAEIEQWCEQETLELCGRRYAHTNDPTEPHRIGKERGTILVGGQKITFVRPRLRQNGKEMNLKTYKLIRGAADRPNKSAAAPEKKAAKAPQKSTSSARSATM